MKDLKLISGAIVDAAFHVHSKLGRGVLEPVYEVVLSHELEKRGLKVERQKPIPIEHGGIRFEEGFRADLILEDCVVVEKNLPACIQNSS